MGQRHLKQPFERSGLEGAKLAKDTIRVSRGKTVTTVLQGAALASSPTAILTTECLELWRFALNLGMPRRLLETYRSSEAIATIAPMAPG
jgi:hypothetical protein